MQLKSKVIMLLACLSLGLEIKGQGVNGQLKKDTMERQDTKQTKLYHHKSAYSVSETMARLEQLLKEKKISIFAKFDHQKNAEEVGLKMRANQVIVFGDPKVGTLLMLQDPSVSVELPLRISVWEDEQGQVWLSFPVMKTMTKAYNLADSPIVPKIQKLMEDLVSKVGSKG